MGNCFSDPSADHKKASQGQKLGSAPSNHRPQQVPVAGTNNQSSISNRNNAPPRTLGDVGVGSDGDPRERALRAAEERAKAAQTKGVNTSNPKAGQLSAKLAAENKKPSSPNVNDNRMMDRGEWN
ncbi:uncharacterized protein IL334_005658 [Kwoniella shivajii]|uniref:SMP domain-containing protein n=1 Tax=Kwoniella shivajii TaxID=564305 RepID=A0ABZ1D3R6_9TREE|nr:hypothetical protein IL334_005658 [Kwoniella shivajii]